MNLIPELISLKNKKDRQIIRLWKRKHDNNIALYFFNKYKDEILNIVYYKFNNKFTSLPFEKNDLFHIVWKSILNCLKEYDMKQNMSFKSMIIKRTYWLTLREAEKFLSNDELVMNTAYSYEKLFEINKNFNLGKNGKNGLNTSYQQAINNFIEEVVSFNKTFDLKTLKKVIYLKSLGYTPEEISKQMKLKLHYVKKIIFFICKIAKKLYD